MNSAIPFGRCLEDFAVGDVYEHLPGKTITESDNNLFCLLTMNHHPVHLDWQYAGQAQHGKVLVVGTLVFSLVVGMTVRDVSGRAIANLEYEKVEHTHQGSIGKLCNDEIARMMKEVLEKFWFNRVHEAIQKLSS